MNPLEFLAFSEAASFGKQLSAAQMHQRYMAAQSPRRQQRINRRIDRQLDRTRVLEPIGMTPYGIAFGARNLTSRERKSNQFRANARQSYRQRNIGRVIYGAALGGIAASSVASAIRNA